MSSFARDSSPSKSSLDNNKEPVPEDEKYAPLDSPSETSSLEIVEYPWRVKGPALL